MRKILFLGLFLIILIPAMGISINEKTYITTPGKDMIKINFPDLTKEYNLKDEALKEGKTAKEFLNIKKTKYFGDADIKLMEKINITKQKIKSSYDCNCKDKIIWYIDNKTKENKSKIINNCEKCYIYENYVVEEMKEINPENYVLKKNKPIYEVFKGCKKIEKLNNGKWGCSIWTNVNVLGTEIKGATWWNLSWDYKQPINISNIAGDLTNYQVKIELNSTNVGSNFNWSNNGSDIRFTNSTDDLLNFWVEDWDSTADTSIIWVNVTSITNNANTTIYMYYGNSGASSASNGENTFEFFDGFSGASLNTTKWDSVGTINIDGGYCKLNPTETEKMFTKSSFWYGVNYSFRWRADLRDDGGGIDQHHCGWMDTDRAWHYYDIFVPYSDIDDWGNYGDGSDTNSHTFTSGFKTYEISRDGSSNVYFYENDSQTTDATNHIPTVNLMPYFYVYVDNTDQEWIDWTLVRKYVSPEPTYTIGSEEKGITYPTLNWTYQPEINLTDEINPTFLFNMSNVNTSTVIFYHGLNDTIIGDFNKSFRYFKDYYILRNCNRDEGDNLSEDNAIKYYTNDIGSYGSHRYSFNERPIIQDSGDNWYLFNFTANYHHLLENHVPVDLTNLTKELKTSQYLEIWKDNPAIIKLKTFPLEVNRTIHLDVNIDDQTASKPLDFYLCNDSINPETVNPLNNSNCGFYGSKTDFDIKDRVTRNSSYIVLHFGINENGYLNINGGIKATETIYLVMDSEITPIGKAYKLYFANDTGFNDTFLMFEGSGGWTFTNRSETPDSLFEVTADNDSVVYYVHACNTSDVCKNFTLQVESLGARPNEPPTTPLLISPATSEKVNGTYNITWLDGTDAEGNPFNITILLYLNGVLNSILADNNITNGTEYYEWNTTEFSDSDLYEIIIYATDTGGLSSGNATTGFFEIDNIPTFPIATYSKRLFFYPIRKFYYI